VNGRTLPPARVVEWQSPLGTISTAGSTIDTDDPMASAVMLPVPTLTLVFGGKSAGDISLTRAIPPASAEPSAAPPDIDREPPAHPHRIELSIDSLPNYMLIEPIPVAIDPLGDAAFTAWVRNLDTNATGHSVVEALLLLKERIEFVYDDLNKRAHLSNEQKTTLQMLHTYIAPKRPEWV
jgi:hypothetical protein